MELNWWLIGIFTLGMVVQMFFMLKKYVKGDWLCILGVFIAGILVGLIPGKHEVSYDYHFHVFLIYLVIGLLFSVSFRKRLITPVTSSILIILNVVTIVVLRLQNDISSHWWAGYLLIAVVIFSCITLLNGITNIDKKPALQVLLYVWFLLMVILLAFSHFSFYYMQTVFGWENQQMSLFEAFITGMGFLYVVSRIWFIYELIPIFGSFYTKDDNDKKSYRKQHRRLLAYGYVSIKNNRIVNALLLIVLPLFFLINYQIQLFSKPMTVTFVLASIPIVQYLYKDQIKKGDGIGSL